MRVSVLDYSGHPCQVQLSRALAATGHVVDHFHCPQYTSGKGALERTADDPATFDVHEVGDASPLERYRLRARLRHEQAFAVAAEAAITATKPDVVILSNVPLLAHVLLARRLAAADIPMVFWQQDVYSEAIRHVARRRLGPAGAAVGALAERLERSVARRSAAVVAISPSFLPHLRRWGVPDDVVTVVPNWAPLAEMPLRPRDNDWAGRHGLVGHEVALYAGTLGLKHDPALLLELAHTFARERPGARVVVVSEGAGRQWLEERSGGLAQLVLLDYQSYVDLPDVLGTADVLLCLLEPAAGAYSVPSKVLNYLCAGRAVVASVPASNGAAQMITDAGAGAVVEPGDGAALASAVLGSLADGTGRRAQGERGRRFAETHFDPAAIVEVFQGVLTAAAGPEPIRLPFSAAPVATRGVL